MFVAVQSLSSRFISNSWRVVAQWPWRDAPGITTNLSIKSQASSQTKIEAIETHTKKKKTKNPAFERNRTIKKYKAHTTNFRHKKHHPDRQNHSTIPPVVNTWYARYPNSLTGGCLYMFNHVYDGYSPSPMVNYGKFIALDFRPIPISEAPELALCVLLWRIIAVRGFRGLGGPRKAEAKGLGQIHGLRCHRKHGLGRWWNTVEVEGSSEGWSSRNWQKIKYPGSWNIKVRCLAEWYWESGVPHIWFSKPPAAWRTSN